ncbi:hypothetical protein [Lutibacter sp.]|uniref:hypothetical protein n=1 Tax=Lutibacter sp. TaxID=1925666 RepID=UPI002734AC1D|nr:hypothetical protein [Lutibacter sp.]MDP3312102.1 hypothetical protein [Lutibacter sp.]
MKIKLLSIFIGFIIFFNANSQEKRILIEGKIFSSKNPAISVHIVNLNSSFGTISYARGEFEIPVKLNDTLLFSSIEFEIKKILITKNHIQANYIEIHLISSTTNLKEIFLKGLIGTLSADIHLTPKDTVLKHSFVFKLSDLDKELPPDKGFKDAPFAGLFPPLPPLATIPDFAYEAEQREKRELKRKKDFPNLIKSRLGIRYFTETLKIPEDNINHFLAYCENRNVVALFYDKKLLELIEIIAEESKLYNQIKN